LSQGVKSDGVARKNARMPGVENEPAEFPKLKHKFRKEEREEEKEGKGEERDDVSKNGLIGP